MSISMRWVIGLVVLLGCVSLHAAEVNIAFVNSTEVLERAPQAESARVLLQSEFASRDAQIVTDQKKLRVQEERLSRDALSMGEGERRKLEREVVLLQRELKRARDEFNEDLNIRRNEEFAKLQREVARVIVEVAKEDGYDLVLENGVVYASDRVDITNQVIERLSKNRNSASKQ